MFSTKDFNTMVLLKYHGYRWEHTEKDARGSRWVFVKDSPALQQHLLQYDNAETTCNLKKLFHIIEEMKEFVHR